MKKIVFVLLMVVCGISEARDDERWKKESEYTNKSLPSQVDKATTMLTTSYIEGELILNYELSTQARTINKKKVDAFSQKTNSKDCTTPFSKEALNDGVVVIHRYFNANGYRLFDVTTTRQDCK